MSVRARIERPMLVCLFAALLVQAYSGAQPQPNGAGPRPAPQRGERLARVPRPRGREFYVAPAGTPHGDGSRQRPWDLATAFAQPPSVKPGDTVWLRAGRYGEGGAHALIRSRLVGTPEAPILVRAYPGERAILDAWLQVGCCEGHSDPSQGAWVWFQDLEFAGYNPDRTSARSGPPDYSAMANHAGADSWAPGARFIDCIVHDTSGGLSLWAESAGAEAYGNIIYHVGGQGPDRGHGHGFYVQNSAGMKHIVDNIVFNNFGDGLQAYGSSNTEVRSIVLEGNAFFNNGSIASESSASDNILFAGGRGGVRDVEIVRNFTYFRPGLRGYNELGYPWSTTNTNALVSDNYFVGGLDAVDVWRWQALDFRHNLVMNSRTLISLMPPAGPHSYRWDANLYYGSDSFTYDRAGKSFASWRGAAGVDAASRYMGSRPVGVTVAVRPNRYQPGRANIVVYNWESAPKVTVDLAGVLTPGAAFEVRDAQNYFGPPVLRGVYRGAPIELPMTGFTAAQPNGNVPRPAVHTAPEFAVFVLRRE